MTQQELEQRVHVLENLLANLIYNGEYKFLKNVNFGPGATLNLTGDVEVGTSGSKVGFYGATKIVQQSAVTAPSGGSTIDSQSRTAITSLIAVLHNLGLTT